MSTTAPTTDSTQVPVTLDLHLKVSSKESVENADDFKRVIDEALDRKDKVMAATGQTGGVTFTGTLTIGKQKIKL